VGRSGNLFNSPLEWSTCWTPSTSLLLCPSVSLLSVYLDHRLILRCLDVSLMPPFRALLTSLLSPLSTRMILSPAYRSGTSAICGMLLCGYVKKRKTRQIPDTRLSRNEHEPGKRAKAAQMIWTGCVHLCSPPAFQAKPDLLLQ